MELHTGFDLSGLELPQPDALSIEHSKRLVERMIERIDDNGGLIGFDEYMRMAMYEPGLGDYSADAIKFGAFGDFVTAPEISPLFGNSIARQARALIEQGAAPRLLEFGAGSGRLCGQILQAMPELESYRILDLSAELVQRQQYYLGQLLDEAQYARIEWLTALPGHFDGIVVANEVLDAMPVHLLHKKGGWSELGVGFDGERLVWKTFDARQQPLEAIERIEACHGELPQDYRCELNLNLRPWFRALAQSCDRAIVLVIDYGHEQAAYYHPARLRGTLECYYQHRQHSDPLVYPGLQDITASVDFDACADAAEAAGFGAVGLVSQRRFLIENGLLEDAQRLARGCDTHEQLALSQQVKTLTMPDEMGQQFKVLALAKGIEVEMPALRRGSGVG